MIWPGRGVARAPRWACWRACARWNYRLCDAGSKLGVLRWLETVALPVDFGFADGPSQHQHLLRSMDILDEYSVALSDQDLSVVFYDLTTVGIEGATELTDDVRRYARR
jgi:hypothetical protein